MSGITAGTARDLIRAAEEKALEIDVPMCIAIMDDGADLVSFHRI